MIQSDKRLIQYDFILLKRIEMGGRVIGYWLLVIGYWLLVIGYWFIVISLWLVVQGS
ncbi:MAG: hypothetical protein AAFY20_04225 [Cyanobacteria bacterium J06639_14]